MLVGLTGGVDRHMQAGTHVTISALIQPNRFTIRLSFDNLTSEFYLHFYDVDVPVAVIVYVLHVYVQV